MKKQFGFLFSVFLLLCLCFSHAQNTVTILPLDQIKAGMKGKGKTVFEGDKIEEFEVELLGVVQNADSPKKSIIWAKLRGPVLDNAGVIEGMSGSPVYVDGKLIGAVAYTPGHFTKEAIAGITPIEEMLEISEREVPKISFSPQIPFKKHLSLEELVELNKKIFLSKASLGSKGRTFTPLSIPLVLTGFSSQVLDKTRSVFSKMGFNPMMGSSMGQTLEKIKPPELIPLREGDPVAVQLISGDYSASAIGTVTHVDGNRVLAFGHPMFNLGSVDYAMAKARVITVVPNLSSSFKIAVADRSIGRFTQDRTSGVLGELGKGPQFIPVNVKLMDSKGKEKEFNIKIVKDKFLTPFFLNVGLSSILGVEERELGDLSLEFTGKVFLDNGRNVSLEDFYSGNYDTSVTGLSTFLASIVYFLTNNDFKDLGIHRIDLNIRSYEEVKFSYLEKVLLDKYEAAPGEKIHMSIYYRTFGGEQYVREIDMAVPHLPAGSEFHLVVADAASLQQIELGQYRIKGLRFRSLNQLVRLMSNLRKNNRIYLKIIASKPGLFMKGEEMPNLPPSMKFMFSSPRAVASHPVDLSQSTLGESQLRVPSVFKGMSVIPIKIRK